MEFKNGFQNSNNNEIFNYEFIDVFKNPNNLPINQIHLERSYIELCHDFHKNLDISEISDKDVEKKFCERKTEILPALDKRWLPKLRLHNFEPYIFSLSKEENASFIENNVQCLEGLNYLLQCNFHQFWCTILFEPSAVIAIRSFIMNPIMSFQVSFLEEEYQSIYKAVFHRFLLVYERLITFSKSPSEYMKREEGMKFLIQKKLMNLPIVITLTLLYKNTHLDFINDVMTLYFSDMSQVDFQIKEVEEIIKQAIVLFEMVHGHICGFDKDTSVIPISIPKRPRIFSLQWIYTVVNYLLNTVSTLNCLLQFYKPSVEMALNYNLPYHLPTTYVNVYRELYEMLEVREEILTQKHLTQLVLEEINRGRSEFIEVFHMFVSFCLDKILESIGDTKQQENVAEIYLKLLTTALEDEYFVCDYNLKHNVATLNEMFESCCSIDSTRTEFITSCINQLPRHQRLEQFLQLTKKNIINVFKECKPLEIETKEVEPEPSTSKENSSGPGEQEIEEMIKNILDMFPHLGDGYILQCLEAYSFNSSDVINAILEENLPPHLYEIPFDSIRIPPEPEPEKPKLAYKGKKPEYDDALKLLNDKKDMKEIKTFVLEGVQYTNNYLYDDEYDDRYDDAVPIRVVDNPLSEEVLTFNPNHEDLASDTSYSSDEEYDDNGKHISKTETNSSRLPERNKLNFCEDPALLRERREAKYHGNQNQSTHPPKTRDVVGNAKGQGQDKSVLLNRQKKSVHKSSRANHNRKSGAQWKRNKGMF